MKIKWLKLFIAGLAAPALFSFSVSATAQEAGWPAKTVSIVVPYLAGGGVDPVARLVAQKLAERWKQSVVVENRAGGSGTIGASAVVQAPADGYTILMSATAEVVINQHFMTKMGYVPERDLKPVTLLVKLPFALVTAPNKPYADMAGLIAYAKQHPGELTYASSGSGTPQHLAGVLVEQLAGVSLLHVPFRGVAQAMTDLMSGQVDVGFAGLPTALAQIQAGKLRALGVSSRQPSDAAPGIAPISATRGLEAFELIQWFGVFVPAKTPQRIAEQIQRDIAAVLAMPEVADTLRKQGAEPGGMTMPAFEGFVQSEREKFRKIVQGAKIEQ